MELFDQRLIFGFMLLPKGMHIRRAIEAFAAVRSTPSTRAASGARSASESGEQSRRRP